MGFESSDVVRFNLGSLLQGQTRILLYIYYILYVTFVCYLCPQKVSDL